MIDLSIIIVNWNVRGLLKKCLDSIYKSVNGLNFEVFVVDNASEDGSAGMVREKFPQTRLIVNKENLGFAVANNQGIREARGEFILLLNPDTEVMPDTLANMVKWMRNNKQVSLAGCHLVNGHGDTINHVRRFPTIWSQIAIVLKLPHIFPSVLNKYLRYDFNYNRSVKVDSIRGGFFMIRQEIIKKIGMLDERYFLWFEEVDFCRRVKQVNSEVWYTPVAKCVDYVGQSFKQLPRGQTQKYFRDSMLKYFKKWQPTWQYLVLKMAWPVGMFLTWAGEKVKFKPKVKT